MAIGTHRSKVRDRVKFIFAVSKREWIQVMHMNEAFADSTISGLEIEPTHNA